MTRDVSVQDARSDGISRNIRNTLCHRSIAGPQTEPAAVESGFLTVERRRAGPLAQFPDVNSSRSGTKWLKAVNDAANAKLGFDLPPYRPDCRAAGFWRHCRGICRGRQSPLLSLHCDFSGDFGTIDRLARNRLPAEAIPIRRHAGHRGRRCIPAGPWANLTLTSGAARPCRYRCIVKRRRGGRT